MSWKLVDDPALVASLAGARRVSSYIINLNPDGQDLAIAMELLKLLDRPPLPGDIESALMNAGAEWPHQYQLVIYGTQPATIVVFDVIAKKTFGVYVWTGAGGAIASARDPRVGVLADAIGDAVLGESSSSSP